MIEELIAKVFEARNVVSLENIVDEITGLYLKTLYKLENLS